MNKYDTLLSYLTEAKVDDEYQRNYSEIDRKIFDDIVKLDPKSKVINDEVTNIGFGAKQLLLRCYLEGETDILDHSEDIKKGLETYYPHISEYPKFPEFNSVSDFLKFIENPKDSSIELKSKDLEDPVTKIYNKYYSEIERSDFDSIIGLDPKTNKNSIGEIAKNLLLPKFKAGEKDFITNSNTKRACELYYEDKNKLPEDKQQLGSYNSVEDFIKYVIEGPESALVASLKQNTTVDPKTHRQVKDDFSLIASTQDYDIIEPKSHRANYAISGGWNSPNGMHWCTGWEPDSRSENDNFWNSYTSNGARLFCIMHKTRNRGTENRGINWQVQIKSDNTVGEFLNGHDSKSFNGKTSAEEFKNFLKAYPNICNAIKDKDPFNKVSEVQQALDEIKYLDEPYILDSEEALNNLRKIDYSEIITKVIISIEKIPTGLFAKFLGMKSVEFKEGVKEIGAQAFMGCSALTGPLVFPESLEIIGAEAFANCPELKGSIRIPNNVTEIRTRAFMGDHCKLKIDKSRTTKIKFDIIDKNWVNSHVQSISVQ